MARKTANYGVWLLETSKLEKARKHNFWWSRGLIVYFCDWKKGGKKSTAHCGQSVPAKHKRYINGGRKSNKYQRIFSVSPTYLNNNAIEIHKSARFLHKSEVSKHDLRYSGEMADFGCNSADLLEQLTSWHWRWLQRLKTDDDSVRNRNNSPPWGKAEKNPQKPAVGWWAPGQWGLINIFSYTMTKGHRKGARK